MAEWLGQMMSSWPTWAIAVCAVIVGIIGMLIYIVWSGAELPTRRKAKYGKK